MELVGEPRGTFNAQATMELKAAVVYRQFPIDMDALDPPGIAGWFRAQSAKGEVHADKFITHMLGRDATLLFDVIKAQTKHAITILEASEVAFTYERKVSEAIRSLYRLADLTDDTDALPLLNWFINEQTEEEFTVSAITSRIKLIGNDGNGILRLNEGLDARGTAAE